MTIERKAMACEFKADAAGDGSFTGYGSVFGVADLGGDMVKQGAFAESLAAWRAKGKLPKLLWQHNAKQPIGVWTSMQEDNHGLLVQGKFTKGVQAADEAYALLRDGALDGLSIGYETVDAETVASPYMRVLKQLKLYEVSVVTMPMCEQAVVTNVKTAGEIKTVREFEEALREQLGYSHAAARGIAANGFKAADNDDGLDNLLRAIREAKGQTRT